MLNGTTPNDYIIDPYTVNDVYMIGDALKLNVSYGGGCEEHKFALQAYNYFLESIPVQADILLSHDSNGDLCEAYLTEDMYFDLTLLKNEFNKAYPNAADKKVILNLYTPNGQSQSITYDFN